MLIEGIVPCTLGIKDHRVVSVTCRDHELRSTLDAKKKRTLPCSICKKRSHTADTPNERRWRHVSVWGIPVVIYYRAGAVEWGREQERYQTVRLIGIDEINRKRGHMYHTTVYDLERKRLIWSGAQRVKDSLRRFFASWGTERSTAIEGGCCDIWQHSIDVIHE